MLGKVSTHVTTKWIHPIGGKGYLVLGLLISTLIMLHGSISNAAIDMKPYYTPGLVSGHQKTWLEDGKYWIATVLSGTVLVNGKQTIVTETTGGEYPGYRSYDSMDATGFYHHREFAPNVYIEGVGVADVTITFSPPALESPPILNVGQPITSKGGTTWEYVFPDQGTFTLLYSYEYSYTALGFETITVPLGAFYALKLAYTQKVYGTNYGEYESFTINGTLWAVANLGVVKRISTDSEGETNSAELVDINFNVLGDLDGDFAVGISDAIVGLQVLSNLHPSKFRSDYVNSDVDINGNNKLDLGEIVFILQQTSGLR